MVRCLKGYTNTAVGLSVADIVMAILHNTQAIIPVSTLVQVYVSWHALSRYSNFIDILFIMKKSLAIRLIANK